MNPTPYELLGGEVAVRALVRRFYHLMDTLPQARSLREMHPDLASAEEKLYLFLSGWFGGPDLYVDRFGPPFLRARHMPFKIGVAERDQWMSCMTQALTDTVDDESLRMRLLASFQALANHMRNQPEPSQASTAPDTNKSL